ncbi:hypothetical protein Ana3638_00675 [Anaerocolumna sedimenticola]|uniref:Uncharacterized protein n=1 Tax=Anaerocolumna sedimenticola TaxID=2696063 RepID=A0A6P1TGE8_9FIRM|nr:hypothetical protein [Anaerocolumna sedimenticola]QHQ59493.1 hypothetical protein Ana3638_00675 [Anaerocolumna sedimenticola]
MKKQTQIVIARQKAVSVLILYTVTLMIIFLGIFFTAFSLINGINISVLNSRIPGVIFGLLVLYLGIRYYLSVSKLKEELSKSTYEFSWKNFKKNNKN